MELIKKIVLLLLTIRGCYAIFTDDTLGAILFVVLFIAIKQGDE